MTKNILIGIATYNESDNIQKLLEEIIKNKLLRARAVYSIFPANSVGDDIEVYNDEKRKKVVNVSHYICCHSKFIFILWRRNNICRY